jgi:hypothetical protein
VGAPGIGARSYWQIGREATWGSVAAATKRLNLLNQSIRSNLKQVKDESMTGQLVARDIVNVLESAAGSLEGYLQYNELLLLLDGIFGTDTYGSSGGTVSGSNPWTFVFTDREFFNSYTLELIEANIPSTKCQRVLGAKFNAITISGDAAGICKYKIDVIGKQKQTNQTPTGALTAATPSYVLTSHGTATSVDGSGDAAADQIIKSFEFTMQNSLDASREDVGSAQIIEPLRNGLTMARLKLTREFHTKTALDAYIAATNQNPLLNFTSGSLQFQIEMNTARIVSEEHGINTLGIPFQTTELEAILTSTTGAKITVINTTNSTIIS